MNERSRWPRAVYGVGDEPDPRFTLANERTFLAWIRTALALLAAGVGLQALILLLAEPVRQVLAAVLVILGSTCAVAAWSRWARSERALRQSRPLPVPSLAPVLTVGVALIGAAVLLAALLR